MGNDDLKALLDESINSVTSDWLKGGLSEKEISEKLTDKKIKNAISEVMDKSVEDSLYFFKSHMYEISYDEQAKTDEFVSRQRQTWGSGLVASQTILWLLNQLNFSLSS